MPGWSLLDETGVEESVNARLLAAGHAYPAFYATLPAALRTCIHRTYNSTCSRPSGERLDVTIGDQVR